MKPSWKAAPCRGPATSDEANVDDGSCEFESCSGCLSDSACNYDPEAVYAAECIYPEEGYDCDGVRLSDVDGDGVRPL